MTCYPSNALFYTNQRLVVSLSLVKTSIPKTEHALSLSNHDVPTLNARQPTVPVPPPLAAQGLTLASDYAPMGTLTILGTPNSRYVQSPAALLAQDAALVAYFGGIKTLAEGHLDWWNEFAPNVDAAECSYRPRDKWIYERGECLHRGEQPRHTWRRYSGRDSNRRFLVCNGSWHGDLLEECSDDHLLEARIAEVTEPSGTHLAL